MVEPGRPFHAFATTGNSILHYIVIPLSNQKPEALKIILISK